MSKIKPTGVVPKKAGPTITCNDPLTFKNGSGSKTKSNGVSRQGVGPTLNVDSSLISQPMANKTPKATKVLTSKSSMLGLSERKTATSYGGSNGGDGRSPSVK